MKQLVTVPSAEAGAPRRRTALAAAWSIPIVTVAKPCIDNEPWQEPFVYDYNEITQHLEAGWVGFESGFSFLFFYTGTIAPGDSRTILIPGTWLANASSSSAVAAEIPEGSGGDVDYANNQASQDFTYG